LAVIIEEPSVNEIVTLDASKSLSHIVGLFDVGRINIETARGKLPDCPSKSALLADFGIRSWK
jgi:hypothetical protein